MCDICDRELTPILADEKGRADLVARMMPRCKVVSDAIVMAFSRAVNECGLTGHPGSVAVVAVLEALLRQFKGQVVTGKSAELAALLTEAIGEAVILVMEVETPNPTQGMVVGRLPPAAKA